jgi:hypothetical protein
MTKVAGPTNCTIVPETMKPKFQKSGNSSRTGDVTSGKIQETRTFKQGMPENGQSRNPEIQGIGLLWLDTSTINTLCLFGFMRDGKCD